MVTKLKREAYQAFAKRLIEACERDPLMPRKHERGFTKALGMRAGIGYKGAEKWIKGESMPDMGNATVLAKSLNVSVDWLITGRDKAFAIEAREGKAEYRLPSEYLQLAADIAALPPKARDAIKHLMDAIREKK